MKVPRFSFQGCLALTQFAVLLTLHPARAGDATWNLNPTSGDWNTTANWTPATVPNGPADVATFATSNIGEIFLSADTEVSQIVFGGGASSFTTTVNSPLALILSGPGIANDSSEVQTFVINGSMEGSNGVMQFTGGATAGGATYFTVNGGPIDGSVGGSLEFYDTASAANAAIVNNTTQASGSGAGRTTFFNNSSAASATITAQGTPGFPNPFIDFMDSSSADNANLILNGGYLSFFDHSTAANATITVNENSLLTVGPAAAANARLIANNGSILISIGDAGTNTARVELHGGTLSLTFTLSVNTNVGSLEGDGLVFIPLDQILTVGNNDLSTLFSGLIQDDMFAAAPQGQPNGGRVTKVGAGTLTLTHANTYSGGSIVKSGVLRVRNETGSATGPAGVRVDGGVLSGGGIIEGAVTLGTGSGAGAVIAPGEAASQPATLTLRSTLTCKADSTYTYKLNTKKAKADQVLANGVTIESGAQFNLNAVANKRLTAGQVFTAISNTAATPISGTFANLADGSTFSAGHNNFQVSYEGGDGNDLTLTVVP